GLSHRIMTICISAALAVVAVTSAKSQPLITDATTDADRVDQRRSAEFLLARLSQYTAKDPSHQPATVLLWDTWPVNTHYMLLTALWSGLPFRFVDAYYTATMAEAERALRDADFVIVISPPVTTVLPGAKLLPQIEQALKSRSDYMIDGQYQDLG